jgi:N-acetylmuramoyl-L-alanine amidase
MPSPLRIVVAQGHRNTGGGNPAEAARTPAIANAVTSALRTAGHAVVSLQNDDGSADDWFDGSLDAVARRVMTLHRQQPIDLMLDIHLEGDPANTPGVFAIVPDGDGLRTLTSYTGTDSAASNSRDRALAAFIAGHVARETGLALRSRGVIAPGVMSERQTHVGADLGWRLAMFAYTAPARDRMVRLVLECGNIAADRAIIDRPDFAGKVAVGVVAGIGGQPPSPTSPSARPFGQVGRFPSPQVITVTADALRVRKWAETSQPIVAEWQAGTQFWATGWVIGEEVDGNPVWWITGDGMEEDRAWRVWSGGTDHAGLARSPTLG